MIISIQLLRGIAAYLVVFGHMPDQLLPGPLSFLRGAIGVDIFFVISGFIMAMAVHNGEQGLLAAKNFYRRRFIRIVPIFIIVSFAIMIWNRTLFGSMPDMKFFLRSLTLFPVSDEHGVLIYPYLSPSWTLTFEMCFYGCIGLLIFIKKYSFKNISILLLSLVSAGYVFSTKSAVFATFLASINIEFLLGIALFQIYIKLPSAQFVKIGKALLVVGIPAFLYVKDGVAGGSTGVYQGLAVIFGDYKYQRWLLFGVPSFMVIWGLLSLEPILNKWKHKNKLVLFGDSSYSLYLLHLTIIPTVNFFIPLTSSKHLLVLVPVLWLVSTLFYLLIEKPVLIYFKSWGTGQRLAVYQMPRLVFDEIKVLSKNIKMY